MTQIYTLLVLALQLLTLVSSTPNAPADLRQTAINVANSAIVEANKQIALSQQSGTIVPTPEVAAPAPIIGSLPQPTTMPEDKSAITASIIRTVDADPVNSIPFGTYIIQVRVLDSSGKSTCGTFCDDPRNDNAVKIPVVMSAPDNVEGETVNRIIDTRETPSSTDFYRDFQYIPKTKGKKTVTFTSGNLTTSLDIVVK